VWLSGVYRTCIGTRFYDRREEVDKLRNWIKDGCYVVVWGPRNVGKSELLRYVARLLEKENWFTYYVDVREYLANKVIQVLPRSLEEEFVKAISSIIGLPDKLLTVFEYGVRYAIEKRASGVLWVVDEPQYLNNMRAFLESLIKRTIYTYHEKPLSVVVCVSEGWFILSETLLSLINYGSRTMLVDWLGISDYKLFARELLELKKTSIEIDIETLYDRYTGGVPGALVSITNIGLSQWVKNMKEHLLSTLRIVSRKIGVDVAEVKEFIKSLPRRIDYIKPSKESIIVEELTKHNILYFNPLEEKPLVKIQLPVYKTILLQ